MSEGCQQIILAPFGESWPSSAVKISLLSARRSGKTIPCLLCPYHPPTRGCQENVALSGRSRITDYRFAQPLLRHKLLSDNDLQEVLPECCPKIMRERRILHD
jgi:hypothetical protein